LAEQLQDLKSKAKILWNLLLISYFTPEEANVEYGIEAMTIAREHNSKEDLAYILHDLSRVYASINKFEEAKGHIQESQGYWRELGNLPMLADSLTMAAYVQLEAGNFERALTLSQESFEISQSINNLWGQAYSLTMIAPALSELGRISEGIIRIREGQEIAQEAKFIGMKILSPTLLSWLFASLGNFPQSNKMLEQAWIDVQEMEMFLRHVQIVTAWVNFREGHMSKAFDQLKKALSHAASEFPDVFLGSLITNLQAEIEIERGEVKTALSLIEENTKGMEDGGRALFLPDALRLKAKVLIQMGRDEDGRQTLLEAKQLAQRLDARRSLVFVLSSLLDIARNLGNSEEIKTIQAQGDEVVSFIADHITEPDLKQSFLNLEEVRNFYE
jgi:tetratricopeptide (TPR) repeat protein